MNVLVVAAEVAPWAQVGDLSDMVTALVRALRDEGHDARIMAPHYGCMPELTGETSFYPIRTRSGASFEVTLTETQLPGGIPIFLVGNDYYFRQRPNVYGYADDAYRFAFFNYAAIQILETLGWQPDLLHTHDWHMGLLSAYVRFSEVARNHQLATCFTLHEVMYQGTERAELLDFAGLGWELFQPDGLEFHRQVSLLKSGVVYSDVITTTSELYASEIQKAEFGAGLEGLLQAHHEKITGIGNGLDLVRYDPLSPKLPAPYGPGALHGKQLCKRALQEELRLPIHSEIPLVIVPSRYIDPGSLSLLTQVSDSLKRLEVQWLFYGNKLPELEEPLRDPLSNGSVVQVTPSAELTPRLWAGADLLLMPPRLKPHTEELRLALRYGTIPVTYGQKGLDANLITPFDHRTGIGTGFLFGHYTPNEMVKAFKLALDTYQKVALWDQVIQNALRLDLSWKQTAKGYLAVYEKAIERHQKTTTT